MKCIGKFTDFYIDVTKQGLKIPQDKYLANGKYPIIDQGKSDISGYCNNLEGIFNDVPAIIFGDHTRSIKYVEKPFFIGADGVKILKSINKNNNMKYLYYALLAAKIPNLGYSRHFKILKELNINIYSRKEQDYIVRLLEKVDCLSESYRKYLFYLNKIIKSRFIEMFGDPILNEKQWTKEFLKNITSKIGSGATPKGGKSSYQTKGITFIRSMNVHDAKFEYKDLAYLTDNQARQLENVIVEQDDVFINITGASVARSCIVPYDILPARVNQHVSIIRCFKTKMNAVFLNNLFLNHRFKAYLLGLGESGGATRQAITKQQLAELNVIVPPLYLQNEFANFVQQVDKSKYREISLIKTYQIAEKYIKQEWMRCQTLHS